MHNFPEIITFRITSKCSHNCQYCYGPKKVPDLSFNELKKIFKLFSKKGVKSIVLTGGEPLLRSDITDILKELKKYNFKIFLDTNGDLFFDFKDNINQYVHTLGLPLDHSTEFATYRGADNFQNIFKILEYYKTHQLTNKPKLRIGTVISQDNITELAKIAELLKDYPIQTWKLYQFIPIGEVASQHKEKLLINTQWFLQEANKISNQYSKHFKITISPRAKRANAYFLINPDGTVIMPTDHDGKCEDVQVGHILDYDIIQKWYKLVYEDNYINNIQSTFSHKLKSYPMKSIYNQIYYIAKTYYSEGQSYSQHHVDWMLKQALTISKKEKIAENILIPLVILHDVGYVKAPKTNPFKPFARKAHMQAGEVITKEILVRAQYPKDLIKKIAYYVSVHDNWALGDNKVYQKDKTFQVFNDLDFTSVLSKEVFSADMRILKKNPLDMLQYMQDRVEFVNRPFSTASTRKLFYNQLKECKNEILTTQGQDNGLNQMKEIYKLIWQLAKPYYHQGRLMDVEHIEWMLAQALTICQQENFDDSILIPLVILHDIGYSRLPKNSPWQKDMRRAHMQLGSQIATQILKVVNYPADKINKIANYVAIHDNWAFGEIDLYQKDILLGIVADLDYIWMATPKGFYAVMHMMNIQGRKALEDKIWQGTPFKGKNFSTLTTQKIYSYYSENKEKAYSFFNAIQ